MRDAAALSKREEYVKSMAQRSKLAVMKDASTLSKREGCVKSMAQISKFAIMNDAPIRPGLEEHV